MDEFWKEGTYGWIISVIFSRNRVKHMLSGMAPISVEKYRQSRGLYAAVAVK